MIQCDTLRDRMPAVARGEAEWDAADRAHLGSCLECREELAVVVAAVRLGQAAPSVDPAWVAATVRRRFGARAVAIRRWIIGGAAVAAAAAMLALMILPARSPRTPTDPEPVVAPSAFLPELDSLSTEELRTILGAVDQPLSSVHTLDASGLGDLSDDELTAVLQSMEG